MNQNELWWVKMSYESKWAMSQIELRVKMNYESKWAIMSQNESKWTIMSQNELQWVKMSYFE